MAIRVNYRKIALKAYKHLCAHCGFGVSDVLEVAHVDGDRANNHLANLVILCPNCHKMYDLDLISADTIIEMRDRPKVVDWKKRMKDAGTKAKASRLKNAAAKRRKLRAAGQKAAATRRQNEAVAAGAKKSSPP
jgi:hypothetical protein